MKLQACVESRFNNVAGLRLQHKFFPADFTKFLRTSFFMEHFRWQLLDRAKALCGRCKTKHS